MITTIEELVELVHKIEGCEESIKWIENQGSIEACIENCSGYYWSYLLSKQPQFSEYCDWDRLGGFDWSYLLLKQPQFSCLRR